ncbi:hypothetical protein LIPSTDRAFT_234669 [Lipomyces starkeyi NRRL Y-11557]|uniref:Uncharacterized protein n=1 Tax=Lipomyces starkeyi NRRL Y-11557 TaxID=675824 RepID=A0A1E3QCZ5_LIPST|nr:hypothetical protein LIPSTDRAFT_234669 [Lipomyces starkeyi NRRL Y-11557]
MEISKKCMARMSRDSRNLSQSASQHCKQGRLFNYLITCLLGVFHIVARSYPLRGAHAVQ